MNRRLTLLIILAGIIFAAFSFAEERQEYFLAVGSPKNIDIGFNVGRVDIGDPQVCNFNADRKLNRITLIPLQEGATKLLVYDKAGKHRITIDIIVSSKDLPRFIEQLKRILKDIEGVNISQVETKVVIDGEVYLQEDLDTIANVIKNTPFVVNLVKISRNAQRIIAKKIEKNIGLAEVVVEPFKEKMILKGTVYSDDDYKNAEKIATLYWDAKNVVNVLNIRKKAAPPTRAQTIEISAHYIELNKVYNKNFLFKWVPLPEVQAQARYNFTAETGSSQLLGGIVASFTDLIPRLNYMRSLGIVRVFENPIVSVKSGEPATIFSGTTLLVPIAQANGQTSLQPQQIGVTLNVTPAQFKEDVDLKVHVEVSALGTPTASGIINIDQNTIDTQQFVRSGESIVIGGILRTSGTDIKDRQPEELEKSPGLFTLFKSRDMQNQRSQFIIFITPKIHEFARDANTDLKEYFKLYEVYPSKS